MSPLESGVLSHAEVKQVWSLQKCLFSLFILLPFLLFPNCLRVKETSLRGQISLQRDKQEKKEMARTSLVVHWLRIRLPCKQGTRVQSLVGEDPPCHAAPKPVSHKCWSPRAPEQKPCNEMPLQWEALTPRRRTAAAHPKERKPTRRNEDPVQPKIKKN